jgi:cytochrome c oxidase cbb3-type subunit I/II
MVVAITAYGMATFEGPMLSLKNVNAISHYTDWTIAHVHVGALGWNGFLTFGVLYWLIPRMWRTSLYSQKWASWHFWIGTLGILLYAIPMYWAGWMQSSMWKEFTAEGQLQYQFLDTVKYMRPFYMIRSVGGLLYLSGAILMVVNLWKTAKNGNFLADEAAEAPALAKNVVVKGNEHWHRIIERKPLMMLVFSLVLVALGGLIEMIPTFMVKNNIPTISEVKPYTPLELLGRDLYIREGCYTCHSQMIRPFRSETERYGDYSKSGEFVYDHPFQFGSKRTGPDLAREGSDKLRRMNSWHYNHMMDPGSISSGSIMPAYPWMFTNTLDLASLKGKMEAMVTLGVPYTQDEVDNGEAIAMKQANAIFDDLKKDEKNLLLSEDGLQNNHEIIALIAYLQRLGTDISLSTSKNEKP